MVGTIKKARELLDGNNERAGRRVRYLRPDTVSFIARNPCKNVYEKAVVFLHSPSPFPGRLESTC